MASYDAIVIGAGGVGTAVLDRLARRGVRCLGIDRFPPGHDRGSSHGRSRIIRLAYFEHPDYVPLLRRAWQLWADLETRSGEPLYLPTGLLQVGPAAGTVVSGVLASAQQHSLDVERLEADEIERRFGGFRVPEGLCGVFERQAGLLRVERCVLAQAEQARANGAEIVSGAAVRGWSSSRGCISVETDSQTYSAASLVITAGAWARELLIELELPLVVLRKCVFWYGEAKPTAGVYRAERGCPAFLYELPAGTFYGLPAIDVPGVKLAEHSGGQTVGDPLRVDRQSQPADVAQVESFRQACLPALSGHRLAEGVCLYTMSPDGHFIVDRHPDAENVVFAAGLSGHGFKFAPVLGEALADLVATGSTALPIEFLSRRRFLV